MNVDGVAQSEFNLRQLDELAESRASFSWDRGVRRSDRVAVCIEDSFDDQVHLAALARIGAIPLLVNGRMDPELALGLMARTDPVGLYTDAAHLALLDGRQEKLGSLRWTVTADDVRVLGRRSLPDRARYRHGDDDPVSCATLRAPPAPRSRSSGRTGRAWPVRAGGCPCRRTRR